jgi:negative regulator of flagellin synthesis FlgM
MAIQNVNTQGAPAPKHRPAAGADKAAANGAKNAETVKGAPTPTPAAATSPKADTNNAAGVQISPRAREIKMAKKVVDETPEIREDKVAKFKELIAKGEYKADASKITEGIVKEAIRDEIAQDTY